MQYPIWYVYKKHWHTPPKISSHKQPPSITISMTLTSQLLCNGVRKEKHCTNSPARTLSLVILRVQLPALACFEAFALGPLQKTSSLGTSWQTVLLIQSKKKLTRAKSLGRSGYVMVPGPWTESNCILRFLITRRKQLQCTQQKLTWKKITDNTYLKCFSGFASNYKWPS